MEQTSAGETPHEPGIVSVNTHAGASGHSVARGVFLIIVGAIIIIGVLMGINAWNASRKADRAKEEQAAKAVNQPAQVGPRRVFDTDPAPSSRATGSQNLAKSPSIIVPGVELGPEDVARPIPLVGQGGGPRGDQTSAPVSRFGGEAILTSASTGAPASRTPPVVDHSQDATVSLVRELIGATHRSDTPAAPSSSPLPMGAPSAATPSISSDVSAIAAPSASNGMSSVPSSVAPMGMPGVGLPPLPGPAASGAGPIGGLLTPSTTPKIQAGLLGDRHMILPKGRSIDCALTVRVVNEVAGMATCVLNADVYSDNGRVVLLDRGSEAVGEYTATMAQGQRRLFLLWSRVKTPSGVIINLNSPAADELGTSGLAGSVDNHWIDRLGAAFLLSIVQDAIGFATASAAGGSGQGQLSIFQNSATTGNRMAEFVLQSTINIKPTLYKNQGDRAMIFVARDLDFSTVYALRPN